MTVVLTGNNDFGVRAELKKLVNEFEAKYGEFGVERIDAAEAELGRLLETVSSLPFLASRRLIILSNPAKNKLLGENIEQFLDSVADTTDLIIVESKFDKRLSMYKTLKKKTDFREYNGLDERTLGAWLVSEAKERGGQINATDANYLLQRSGHNQMSLSHELDKLLAYEPKISRESIDLLIEPLPQGSVFDLLDAAFAGYHAKALRLYEDQRRQQVEPQAIMGMIAWQLHVLAVVKYNEKDNAEEIASKAKLNPFVVRKTLGISKSMTKAQVKKLISRALRLDIRLKSEQIDADDAVQHFLLTI